MRLECFLIWTNLNPLHQRRHCAKFGWNWPSNSGEDFKILSLYFCYFMLSPLGKFGALHLNKLESPLIKDTLCKVWLKLAQWFWRRRFLNFIDIFSLFPNYLPLEKVGALHFNNLKSPSPKDDKVLSLVDTGPLVMEKKIFKIRQCIFRNFVIFTCWNRMWPFSWTYLNVNHPRMHYCKFGWNWTGGSGEKDFLILSMYFHFFVIISP